MTNNKGEETDTDRGKKDRIRRETDTERRREKGGKEEVVYMYGRRIQKSDFWTTRRDQNQTDTGREIERRTTRVMTTTMEGMERGWSTKIGM